MELLDYLIPVYAYHNKTIDDLTELERRDKEYRDEIFETSFFSRIAKAAENLNLQEIEDDEEDLEIPDIDHSNERDIKESKKVIPMHRIPSKKRNKGKKKKKRKR
jgi:hypothetical protein